LQAFVDYGPRYQRVVGRSRLGFKPPTDVKALRVVQRIEGDASTDFGVPGTPPKYDEGDVSDKELKRLDAVLRACWRALDDAFDAAHGKKLATGPRGGGRDADKILDHVREAEGGYLNRVAAKVPPGPKDDALERTRKTVLESLAAAAHGEVPAEGPRGGKRWSARYFVRRTAWHALDHAWEIEDRTS
jgi:hypothetical protein